MDEPPVLHSMEFHNSKSTSSLRPTYVPLSELNQSTSPEHISLSRLDGGRSRSEDLERLQDLLNSTLRSVTSPMQNY